MIACSIKSHLVVSHDCTVIGNDYASKFSFRAEKSKERVKKGENDLTIWESTDFGKQDFYS